MSNFWANKLAGAAPAAPAPAAAPQQQPQQSGPWWANPHYTPQPQPQQTVPPQYQQQGYPQGQGQQQPMQHESISQALHDPNWVPKKAKVLKVQTGSCPDCGSGDYFRSPEHPNSMPQCQECGFNPRFHQSSAGVPSGGPGQASATPSRQTAQGGAGGRSNYNPHMLINAKAAT